MMAGMRLPPLIRLDESITRQKVRPGTVRRILPYARDHRWAMGLLLLVTALNAGISVANPLLLGVVIDRGILPRRLGVLVVLSLVVAGLAVAGAIAMFLQTRIVGPYRARGRI